MDATDLAYDDVGDGPAVVLAGCLPDPEVVVMEGVGHLPNLERPDAFNTHLLRFLTSALP
jgi:pimeloyl-ACP methyl ester carboxylesterase